MKKHLSVVIAVISMLTTGVHASVTHDFNPLRMYEDESRPNNGSYFLCAFDGIYLDFSEDVYVDDTKIKDIRILENGADVEDISIELGNCFDPEDTKRLALSVDTHQRVLSGFSGMPYYYTVILPEELFGDRAWKESGHEQGASSPEIRYESQGYCVSEPIQYMMEGDYTLIIPEIEFSVRIDRDLNCPDSPDFIQYTATVPRLENNGFYVEFNQPLPGNFYGGYLVDSGADNKFEYKNEDGSFGYFDYVWNNYSPEPLIFIGDYDYIENAEITIEVSAAPTFSMRIIGTGRYNDPVPPVDDPDYVRLSLSLPGGCVDQMIPVEKDFELFVRPEDGWGLNTCFLGDTDVTPSVADDGRLVINIAEDTVLSVVFEQLNTGVNPAAPDKIRICPRAGDGIEIFNKPDGATVSIFTADGSCVYSGNESYIPLPGGFYVVKIDNVSFKLHMLK